MGPSCRTSCIGLLAVVATALAACGGGDDASTASTAMTAAATTAALATTTSAPAPTAATTTAPAAVTTTTAAAAPTTTSTTASTTSTTSTTVLGAVGAAGADLKIDQVVDWIRFESVKCGGPIGTWPILVSGTRDVGGGVTLVLSGAGEAVVGGAPTAANGTFAADWTISVDGVPLTTGGQDAHIDGTAAYDGTTLTVEGRPSGTSHGENPYRSVVLAMLSSVERVSLTPVAGAFC